MNKVFEDKKNIINNKNSLALYFLLSIFLHALIFFGIHITKPSIDSNKSMNIYLADPVPSKNHPLHDHNVDDSNVNLPIPLQTSTTRETQPLPIPDDSHVNTVDINELLDSARKIAQSEAIQVEKQIALEEKNNKYKPINLLKEYLDQPHKETRLANGMLKITTLSGINICFTLAPVFAQDSANIFGIATNCP